MHSLLTINVLVLSVILLFGPVKVHSDETIDASPSWSHNDIPSWGNLHPICNNGSRQSPIDLTVAIRDVCVAPISFKGYDVDLADPVTIYNDGHSVGFDVPVTIENKRPTISGGILTGTYEAIGIHLHWGSATSKGAEHTIHGIQQDAELHIVHRNTKYNTTQEALNECDGLAVLGIFLQKTTSAGYTGLNQIFEQLPNVVNYDEKSDIVGSLKLDNLLGNIFRGKFYTYKGSLTTPPCSEAATFIIFPQPLKIKKSKMSLLWNLKDSDDNPLINNFRPVKPLNGRYVWGKLPLIG